MINAPTPEGDPIPLSAPGSRLFTRRTWRYPDGEIHQQYTAVQKPVVAVLPIRDSMNGPEVLLVRQFRPAVGDWVTEAVAGGIDREDGKLADVLAAPEDGRRQLAKANNLTVACAAAHRELTEETGYKAGRLVFVSAAHVSPGWTDEHMHLFLAYGLDQAHAQRSDWDRDNIETFWRPLTDCLDDIQGGEIVDLKTIALLYAAERAVNAKPGGLLTTPRQMSEEEAEAFRQRWNARAARWNPAVFEPKPVIKFAQYHTPGEGDPDDAWATISEYARQMLINHLAFFESDPRDDNLEANQ